MDNLKVPHTVKAALQALSDIANKLPTGFTINCISNGDLGNARKQLAEISAYMWSLSTERRASASAAIVTLTGVRSFLLRLTAEAVRILPTTHHGDGLVGEVVVEGAMLAGNLLMFMTRLPYYVSKAKSLGPLDFVRKLISMQTVQACSRQLAAVAEWLQNARKEGIQHLALDTVFSQAVLPALTLLAGMVCISRRMSCWEAVPVCERLQQYSNPLGSVLRDSCPMEHAARALLVYYTSAAAEGGLTKKAEEASFLFLTALVEADDYELSAAAEGFCAQHVAVAHGLTLLCEDDGGPAYGLQPDLLGVLPVLTEPLGALASTPAPAPGQEPQLHPVCFKAMLAALRRQSKQPLHRRAPHMLALRLLRLMLRRGNLQPDGPAAAELAAGAAAAAPLSSTAATDIGAVPAPLSSTAATDIGALPAPLAAHAVSRTSRLVLRQEHVLDIAVQALELAWATIPSRSGHVEELMAELWCSAVDVGRHACLHADRWTCERLGRVLQEALSPRDLHGEALSSWAPSPLPRPSVAAAIAAGLLPWLEGLQRSFITNDDLEQRMLHFLMGFLDGTRGREVETWLALFTYSDPRQAASWVVTHAKWLRLEKGYLAECAKRCTAVFLNHMEELASGPLAETLVPEGDPAGDDIGQPAGLQHLGRLVSFAVCEWLPTASLLLRHLAWQCAIAEAPHRRGINMYWHAYIAPLARWLSGLVLSCKGRSGDADCGGSSSGGGSWVPFLLHEVAVVPLLGSLLHLCRSVESDKGADLAELLDCCGVVASAFPQEVQAAVREAEQATIAPPVFAWPPAQVRGLAPKLRESGHGEAADAALALAARLEAWGSEGGAGSSALSFRCVPERLRQRASERGMSVPDVVGVMRRFLVPPAEARRLLRTCSNPACVNLEGDSEAELPLKACARCGGAWYCCRECQTAHWRAGHKEACVRRQGAAQG
ncbi:hypothetical protein Agub_g11309 [Astrephomene gubernaculifera]|uniref:phytol kinase n=1 Tax=Astrephomene gubernaculifera TaxID=47775 RepID=A0AAD3DYR7_9CHLO|nr:hypothetical protein Agub_g11309 [Astrephomene gubernaculifera]